MKTTIEDLLHPRVAKPCLARYSDGYYKDAAREAMTQVEQAIKEKSGITNKYGARLITSAFGRGSSIKLTIPYGAHLQAKAEAFFQASFDFHRNYATHEGEKIDEIICLRILVLASELLDLIGASHISYAAVGGVAGLVKQGVFKSIEKILELLSFLDGYRLPNEVSDGFYEDLGERGLTEKHVQVVVELGLVEYTVNRNVEDPRDLTDTVGCFDLTELGKTVLRELSS